MSGSLRASMRMALFAITSLLAVTPIARAEIFRGGELRTLSRDHLTVDWAQRKRPIILRYLAPSFDEYDKVIAADGRMLRGRILLSGSTSVEFYERPRDGLDVLNSEIVVKQPGKAAKTYEIGVLLDHQPLTIAYVALVPGHNGAFMLVCDYGGGATGARQGFAILHFSPSGFVLDTLPLTDFGKVVVFRNQPRLAEVWTALPDYVGSEADPRFYAARLCRLASKGYTCGPPKRQKRMFGPSSIIDPGIEIRR